MKLWLCEGMRVRECESGGEGATRLELPCLVLSTQYLVLGTKYCVFVAMLLAVAFSQEASGQTLLRWKLRAGESFGLVIHQETKSEVAFSAKSATTNIVLDVSLGWAVTASDENELSIKQTIERIVMDLATPQGPAIHFDSALRLRPVGQARDLAEALQPLVGAEFQIKLNPRGEVLMVEPVNEAAKAIYSAIEKKGEAGDAPRATVEKLLRQSLVVLPEKRVNAGESWTTSSELMTAAGPQTQEMVYAFKEISQVDGRPQAEISMESKLIPRNGDASVKGVSPRLKIIDHQQQGKIWFAPEEGRVTSAEQAQKLVTEREYQNTRIVVTLNSTQRTTVEAR
jgi:hypothetical protein